MALPVPTFLSANVPDVVPVLVTVSPEITPTSVAVPDRLATVVPSKLRLTPLSPVTVRGACVTVALAGV